MKFNKGRIAPTPSGFLHTGNLYSFLLTAALTEKAGATLLLRIDDMDTDRTNVRYVRDIFETLHFMEIAWQEGPKDESEAAEFSQHARMQYYRQALSTLIESKKIFACTCSRADIQRQSADGTYNGTCLHKNIPLDLPGVTWRLNTSEDFRLLVKDFAGMESEHWLPKNMKYFIVRRKEGYPAYQLSSLVDDILFGVDFIVRGRDLWNSTLAQVYLAKILNYQYFGEVIFLHHDLITGPDGQKLSKSAGDTSIRQMRANGMNRQDILRHISYRLGPGEAGPFRKLYHIT